MSKKLTPRQRYLLGTEEHPDVFKVVNGTLYYRYRWGSWKGHTRQYQDYWYPVLTKKGKQWIGYNYSPKPCLATHILKNQSELKWKYESLKWVEIGRGIGGKGLSRIWDSSWREMAIITKMINPTVDMLIKPTDDE